MLVRRALCFRRAHVRRRALGWLAVVHLLRPIGDVHLAGIDDGRVLDGRQGLTRGAALALSLQGQAHVPLAGVQVLAHVGVRPPC